MGYSHLLRMTKKTWTKQIFNCLKCKDQNWLKECECGICHQIIFLRSKKSRITRFIAGHTSRKGKHSPDKLGHRIFIHGYWYFYWPTYFSSYKSGYVREHVYFFQEYYKCCMLPWGVVHHIIKFTNRDDYNNMPWNLRGMMNIDHVRIHTRENMFDRFCKICGSNTSDNYNSYDGWYGNKIDGWICKLCKQKEYELIKKERNIINNIIEPNITISKRQDCGR